jgi:hypothetical protein
MSNMAYSQMSIDELLDRFTSACLAQYDTWVFPDEIEISNQQFWILVAIKDELKSRGPQARRSLLRLLNHENPQVRVQAAKLVYPVARDEARKCLQDLASDNLPVQTLNARMTLSRLEEVPDCLDH